MTPTGRRPQPGEPRAGSPLLRWWRSHVLLVDAVWAAGLLLLSLLLSVAGGARAARCLSLSPTQRRQENALLRALGLSRSRLRAMVAGEALVLGLVGATVGVVLGTGFGIAGTYSVVGSSGTTVVDVPWLTLLGLAAVVGAVAVGASLWPADRASRVAPASALGIAA